VIIWHGLAFTSFLSFSLEDSVSRRALLVLLAVLIFAGARLGMNYGFGRAFAAHKTADPIPSHAGPEANAAPAPSAPTASPNYEPASPESYPERAASRPSPAQAPAGVADLDPHKSFGSKSAPIVMEVFSDYQCPACKQLYITTNRQLMDNYVTVGKVFLIHRDFLIPGHAYSPTAAKYARAAAQLGKIEPVEQALFQNQEKWEQTGDVDGTVAAVLSAADIVKVRTLVKAATIQPLIDKDVALGHIYNVNQTPTTIIHVKGQTYPVVGVVTYDTLKAFLDQLLGQK
jgi:protein-disulfide isomerase